MGIESKRKIMCDWPVAGVFTTHETYTSWIIYKADNDAKTNSVLQVGSSQRIKGQSDRRRDSDRDLDNMYMLLDEDLRPATPDMSHPTSVAIFEDHKKLAQEYFEVQTELVYATQHCQKLKSTTQSPEKQKRRQNIRQLEEERDSLRLCRDALIEEQRKLDAVSKRNRNSRLNRRLD